MIVLVIDLLSCNLEKIIKRKKLLEIKVYLFIFGAQNAGPSFAEASEDTAR